MNDLFDLVTFLVLLATGYFAGTFIEKKHYRSLEEREAGFLSLPAVSVKNAFEEGREIADARIVCSNVVVATDYFKLIFGGLRNLFGGRIAAFESVMDRGRREAILRLKEKAIDADIIVNMRLETCKINKIGSVEIFAYGTAISYKITA